MYVDAPFPPIRQRRLLAAAGLAALLLLCFGFFHHEPWRDEIQAWLMARDMDSAALVKNAATEGHPVGWHALLKLLLLLGLPFDALGMLCFAFTCATAALILFRSPFGPVTRAAILFSPPLILLGILARPYSLIVLLLAFQACLFPLRLERPLAYGVVLGLLSQLMVLCVPYVMAMSFFWLWDALRARAGRRVLPGLICCFTLQALALWQLLPPWAEFASLLAFRLDPLFAWLGPGWTGRVTPAMGAAALLFTAAAGAWSVLLWRCAPALMLTAWAAWLFAILVDVFLYPLSDYHWYLLLAVLFTLCWIALDPANALPGAGTRARAGRLLLCTALAVCPLTGIELGKEARSAASNLPVTVNFVGQRLADMPVAAFPMARICPLLKDLPGKRFWNPLSGHWETFAIFDLAYRKKRNMSPDDAARIIAQQCPEPRPAIIFSRPWHEAPDRGYAEALAADAPTRHKEKFYIYIPTERFSQVMQGAGGNVKE